MAREAEDIAANKEQRRPNRSVFALLEKSRGSESTAEVGNVPDREAYGDEERPGWNEPDSLCRIAESCGNMGPNGGHDGDGPQWQAIARGQDLPAASTPGPMDNHQWGMLTPTTAYVLGVTTNSSSSTLISGCLLVSSRSLALSSSEGGSLGPGLSSRS